MYCCHKPEVQGKFEFMDFILRNTGFPIHIHKYVDYFGFFPLPRDKIL